MAVPVEEAIAALSTFSLEVKCCHLLYCLLLHRFYVDLEASWFCGVDTKYYCDLLLSKCRLRTFRNMDIYMFPSLFSMDYSNQDGQNSLGR